VPKLPDRNNRFHQYTRTDNARGFVRYRISDLYMHKENAKIALLAAQQERLSELTDVVAKLEESIQNDEDDD